SRTARGRCVVAALSRYTRGRPFIESPSKGNCARTSFIARLAPIGATVGRRELRAGRPTVLASVCRNCRLAFTIAPSSLWLPRVRPLDSKAGLSDLRGIRRSDTGELRSHVVDDVKIAVGTVVVAQAEIGANRLRVRRVHLHETCKG